LNTKVENQTFIQQSRLIEPRMFVVVCCTLCL